MITTETERETLARELRATFLFETFDDEQMLWLLDHTTVVALSPGEQPIKENEPIEALWVLLSGAWRLTRTVAGQKVTLDTATVPGEWAGWLPMLDDRSSLGAQIVKPTRLLRIPQDGVRHMLAHGFPIINHLLAGLYGGIQNFEALSRQQEKLAALGKMAAGLAHELNNPAAAARRAASTLRDSICAMQRRALDYDDRFGPAQREYLCSLHDQIVAQLGTETALDPLARAGLEDDVTSWLDQHGVVDGWELASALVSAGFDTARLDELAAHFEATTVNRAIGWLEPTITLLSLADEMEHSTRRISDLVSAMKSYSYMDQQGRQEVDLHKGIDDTLKVLHHKLKYGVEVERDYDPAVPRISAYGSELNQVWTNLIDNAIGAMDGKGRLSIRTSLDGTFIRVEVRDSGPGIAPEIIDRIWEPFFTTKAAGDGTGLGLETVRRIVTRHHHGEISVRSQPGNTCFEVCLPVDQG
ncbi:MAG TPA: ATP-binding protein [Herpetosiphonaceae bacterium]